MDADVKELTQLVEHLSDERPEARRNALIKFHRNMDAREALVAMGFKRADGRLAMQRVREALDAKTKTYTNYRGIITDEREDVDHRTRLRAANAVFEMMPGVKAPQEFKPTSGEIQLEVLTVAPDGTRTAVRVTQ